MKGKKYLAYALVPAAAAAFWGANVASAHGWGMGGFGGFKAATPAEAAAGFKTMLQEQASLLGMTEAEITQAWAEGKTIMEMAQAKGITQDQLRTKMDAARAAKMKEQMQSLVSQGVLTQAQADSRIKFMEQHKAANSKAGRGMRPGGMWF